MYSRFQEQPKKPLRVPEHYSGCAFPSPAYPPGPPPRSTEQEETTQASAPRQEAIVADHTAVAEEKTEQIKEPSQKEYAHAVGAFPSLFGSRSVSFPLGMSFDELLIIGLILLLSHTETDSDIVLWLALLLFCK